jgi:hypothetical protein
MAIAAQRDRLSDTCCRPGRRPARRDLHVVGPTAPLIPGAIGCVVIDADGGRRLGQLVRDPLAGWREDGIDD